MEHKKETSEFDEILDEVREDVREIVAHAPTSKQVRHYLRSPRSRRAILGVMVALFVVVLLIVVPRIGKDPATREQERIQRDILKLVERVERHAIVPQEIPVVYTITDVQELQKQQEFFMDATDGDKLLIFPQTAKAVIYSPDRDIVVTMGPVSIAPSDTKSATENQSFLPTAIPEGEVLAPEQAGSSDN